MLGQMKRQLENSRCFRQGMEKDLEECAEARWLAKPVLDSRALPLDSDNVRLQGPGVMSFEKKPTKEEILARWASFEGEAQRLALPSAPKQFLHYFEESDRPQTKLDRNLENGMAVSIGRLRPDTQYDYKFVCLSHNTLRGAAGGAVLLAELLAAEGYMG